MVLSFVRIEEEGGEGGDAARSQVFLLVVERLPVIRTAVFAAVDLPETDLSSVPVTSTCLTVVERKEREGGEVPVEPWNLFRPPWTFCLLVSSSGEVLLAPTGAISALLLVPAFRRPVFSFQTGRVLVVAATLVAVVLVGCSLLLLSRFLFLPLSIPLLLSSPVHLFATLEMYSNLRTA